MTKTPKSTGVFVTALCAVQYANAFVPSTNGRLYKSSFYRYDISSLQEKNECPFIGVFPRFRIPLTTSKAENKGFQWPFLAALQRPMERARLERHYGPLDSFPDQSGILAFCSLWTAVAELENETKSSSRILALPDCDKRILTNWIEMMDWIIDLEGQLKVNVTIRATRLEDQVIRIERIGIPQLTTAAILHNPETIERRTKAWVKRLLVDMGICPFTKSITKSGQGLADLGVPVANIAYHTSQSRGIYLLMADTWKAISNMIDAGPSGKDGISSILLAAPEFDQAFETWSGPVFCLLESGVVAAQAEGQVGVVCFHPNYKTPDGSTFPGFGHMHSVPRLERWVTEEKKGDCPFTKSDLAAGGAWQRRTPHATINVLRADQLEKAETRRQTPRLYTNNIEAILSIGSEQLQENLNKERILK